MRSRDEMVSSTNRKLEQLNHESDSLKEKIHRQEQDCLRNENELKNTSEQLELVMARNKDQAKKIKQG